MLPANRTPGPAAKRENLSMTKATSMDSQDDTIEILGEDSGLGKILLGIRYQANNSCFDVRVARGEGLRSFRAVEPDAPKPSTYCTVSFLPDQTDPLRTVTVENSDCPRWRGGFRFEKFPWIASSTNQRCLHVQVHDATTGSAISEVTLLLGNWSPEEYVRGVRLWKYLSGTRETQRVSGKEGNACMTLFFVKDRLKLTLHRVEDISPRWTATTEPPEFYAKLQAVQAGRVVKEATLKGVRSAAGDGGINFFDGEFVFHLGKHGHGTTGLTVRLVVTHHVGDEDQELYWLDLGAEVKRPDCRNLYESVMQSPNQSHLVSVRLSKPPVAPLAGGQTKHEA